MKYIYFEKRKLSIVNENILLFKPVTNSGGWWTHSNQLGDYSCWVDLEKYNDELDEFDLKISVLVDLNKDIQECILKLKNKSEFIKLKEAIDLLEIYNRWRQGDEIQQLDPKDIGVALNIVINEFRK